MKKVAWHQSRRSSFMMMAICFVGLSATVGCVPRSERDVVVYSALDEEFAFPILDGFERATDHDTAVVAKYDIESTKTVGLVQQIIGEAKRPRCDLFWNNEILHTVRLQKLGLLQSHDWKVERDWPADMIASDGTWCGFAARARVLLINTKMIPESEDRPSSVLQLGDPDAKFQGAVARPLFGTTATQFAVLRETMGREKSITLLKSIAANAMVLSGNKQVAQAVSAGRVAWGLTDTDDAIIEVELGYPVAIVFPDQQSDQPGTLRIPNTIAILKNSPHPIAAERLADYLLTPEIEDRLAMGRSSQMPLSKASKFPPAVLPNEPVRWMRADFETAADGWDEWAKELAGIFAKE